jgi:hypothetical protein
VSVKKFPTRFPFSIFGNFSEQTENLFLNFAWTAFFFFATFLLGKEKWRISQANENKKHN